MIEKCDQMDHLDSKKMLANHFSTKITHLNEETFDVIFKYLSLNDLSTLSETCEVFKKFVMYYFDSKCKTGPIYIKAMNNLAHFVPKKSKNYAYERTFKSMIRSVHVIIHDSLSTEVFKFIHDNCPSNLQSLILAADLEAKQKMAMKKIHVPLIIQQLQNLTELKIVNIFINDVHRELLNSCDNLENLTIAFDKYWVNDSSNNTEIWLNHKYQKLKTLNLLLPNDIFIDLKTFFHLNVNLKNFTSSNVEAIRSSCISKPNLDFVGLLITNECGFQIVRKDLKKWCKAKHVKRFELVISGFEPSLIFLQQVLSFENLGALHCGSNIFQFSLVEGPIFENIEELCMDFKFKPNDKSYDDFEKKFPKLHKLSLTSNSKHVPFKTFALPIVSRSRELTYFEFWNNNCIAVQEDDLVQMNMARSALENATEVFIYLYKDDFINVSKIIQPKNGLVTVKMWHPPAFDLCGFAKFGDLHTEFQIQSYN